MNVFHSQKKRKGFSLVELIVVILIIAILAVAVFAGGSAAIKKSQISRTTSDLHNFSIAIESAMNETPSVANIDKNTEFAGSILKAINNNLAADYQLTVAADYNALTDGTNLVWAQAADYTGSDPATAATAYKIYKSAKTDAWGNPYYVILDATERHDKGISEFYVTVVSAGPNAQTKIGTAVAKASVTANDKGIEADDIFLLVQYTDGDVAAATYNCANDTLLNGAATQETLLKTTKGAVDTTEKAQGYYIGTVLNGDGRATLCPINFQPAA